MSMPVSASSTRKPSSLDWATLAMIGQYRPGKAKGGKLGGVDESHQEEWWSPQHAAVMTGLNEETVRQWSRGPEPRVRRQDVSVGKRNLVRVHAEDVMREAQLSRAGRPGRLLAPSRALSYSEARSEDDSVLLDKVAVLSEVVRRLRMVDEHREEIERQHLEISRQHREIEELLLAPTRVPSN
jgi:hypothetical protein